ncbi:hypothetical protein KR52_06230 [Synechococcus sp. KORDI-52]|nr:hypothetical protein KR52_06230 [Synechococcus sp. KORDI-52]
MLTSKVVQQLSKMCLLKPLGVGMQKQQSPLVLIFQKQFR